LAKDKDKEVFAIKISKVNSIFRKYGWTPHYLRHLRASHLMKYNGFTPADLQQYFSWRSAIMPFRYAQSDRRTIRERLRGNLL
jgi:integrase